MTEAEAAVNLLDDPETGEMISKSELKRRQKQRQKEGQKAEKAAKMQKESDAAPAKAGANLAAEDALTPNQYYEMRCRAIQKLRETRQPDPYPHKFHVSISLTDFIAQYQDKVEAGSQLPDVVSVAGRLHNMRASGQKLRFYDLHAEGVKIQIMAQMQDHKEGDYFEAHDLLRRGDVVGVKGVPAKTKKGELSIVPHAVSYTHLTLPTKRIV